MTVEAKKKAKVRESKKYEPKVPISKYFQLKNPKIHLYTRAALWTRYRNVRKTVKEWEEKLRDYIE